MAKKPKIPSSSINYLTIAKQARAFLQLAQPEFELLNCELNKGQKRMQQYLEDDLAPVACAATLLAFGTELLLKAIYVALQMPLPNDSHHTLKLFNGLPEDIRSDIEVNYNNKIKQFVPKIATVLEISISRPGTPIDETDFAPGVKSDNSLLALLGRSADAFVVWRYFYESFPHDRPNAQYSFEHAALVAFAQTLNDFIHFISRQVQTQEAALPHPDEVGLKNAGEASAA